MHVNYSLCLTEKILINNNNLILIFQIKQNSNFSQEEKPAICFEITSS